MSSVLAKYLTNVNFSKVGEMDSEGWDHKMV